MLCEGCTISAAWQKASRRTRHRRRSPRWLLIWDCAIVRWWPPRCIGQAWRHSPWTSNGLGIAVSMRHQNAVQKDLGNTAWARLLQALWAFPSFQILHAAESRQALWEQSQSRDLSQCWPQTWLTKHPAFFGLYSKGYVDCARLLSPFLQHHASIRHDELIQANKLVKADGIS